MRAAHAVLVILSAGSSQCQHQLKMILAACNEEEPTAKAIPITTLDFRFPDAAYYTSLVHWVLEGSLAGFSASRNFIRIHLQGLLFVQIAIRGGPRRSTGVPGVGFGRKYLENQAENLRPDRLQAPR